MPPRVKCMAHCCQRVPGYDTRIQSGVTALVNASFPAALPPPPPLACDGEAAQRGTPGFSEGLWARSPTACSVTVRPSTTG